MPPGAEIGPAMPPGFAEPEGVEPAPDDGEGPDVEILMEDATDAGPGAAVEKKKLKAPKKPKVVKAEAMCKLNHESVDWIWVGSADDARDCAALRKNNIRYVLNCTMDKSNGGVPNFHKKDPAFTYCRLSMADNTTEHLSQHFEVAWEFFERARIREDGGVLVHCQQGVSRSVSMVISYLMKYYRFAFDDALVLLKQSRSQACPNEGFTVQLKTLEQTLKETNGYEKTPPRRKRAADGQAGGAEKKRSVGAVRGPARGPAMGPSMGPAAGPQAGPSVGPAAGPGAAAAPRPQPQPTVCPQLGPAAGPTPAPSAVGPAAGPRVGPAAGPALGPGPGPTIKGPARPPPAPEPPVVIDKVKSKKIAAGPSRPGVGSANKPVPGPARPADMRKGRSIDLT